MQGIASNQSTKGEPMHIKKLRKKLNMTQAEFALTVGVAEYTVRRWEKGTHQPSRLALRELNRLEKE